MMSKDSLTPGPEAVIEDKKANPAVEDTDASQSHKGISNKSEDIPSESGDVSKSESPEAKSVNTAEPNKQITDGKEKGLDVSDNARTKECANKHDPNDNNVKDETSAKDESNKNKSDTGSDSITSEIVTSTDKANENERTKDTNTKSEDKDDRDKDTVSTKSFFTTEAKINLGPSGNAVKYGDSSDVNEPNILVDVNTRAKSPNNDIISKADKSMNNGETNTNVTDANNSDPSETKYYIFQENSNQSDDGKSGTNNNGNSNEIIVYPAKEGNSQTNEDKSDDNCNNALDSDFDYPDDVAKRNIKEIGIEMQTLLEGPCECGANADHGCARHMKVTGKSLDDNGSHKTDDESKRPENNLLFYQNKMPSRPFPGSTIEEMLEWRGDYLQLERGHSYIQWLFPMKVGSGLNSHAQKLYDHEAEGIINDKDAYERVLQAYTMMLDFYGIKLVNKDTGEVKRNRNWRERFKFLNNSRHNFMRITRMITSIGHLGYLHYQIPLVKLFMYESIVSQVLERVNEDTLLYWMDAVEDGEDKGRLYETFFDMMTAPEGYINEYNNEEEEEEVYKIINDVVEELVEEVIKKDDDKMTEEVSNDDKVVEKDNNDSKEAVKKQVEDKKNDDKEADQFVEEENNDNKKVNEEVKKQTEEKKNNTNDENDEKKKANAESKNENNGEKSDKKNEEAKKQTEKKRNEDNSEVNQKVENESIEEMHEDSKKLVGEMNDSEGKDNNDKKEAGIEKKNEQKVKEDVDENEKQNEDKNEEEDDNEKEGADVGKNTEKKTVELKETGDNDKKDADAEKENTEKKNGEVNENINQEEGYEIHKDKNLNEEVNDEAMNQTEEKVQEDDVGDMKNTAEMIGELNEDVDDEVVHQEKEKVNEDDVGDEKKNTAELKGEVNEEANDEAMNQVEEKVDSKEYEINNDPKIKEPNVDEIGEDKTEESKETEREKETNKVDENIDINVNADDNSIQS